MSEEIINKKKFKVTFSEPILFWILKKPIINIGNPWMDDIIFCKPRPEFEKFFYDAYSIDRDTKERKDVFIMPYPIIIFDKQKKFIGAFCNVDDFAKWLANVDAKDYVFSKQNPWGLKLDPLTVTVEEITEEEFLK